MPALAPPQSIDLVNELDRYLSADVEHVTDTIVWWHERRSSYPCLSRMALDYLTIPGTSNLSLSKIILTLLVATSVDVERLFSRGRLLLTHVRSRLSAQSTRALLCLGAWSRLNLVKDEDVTKVATLPDVDGDADEVLEDGWDRIRLN